MNRQGERLDKMLAALKAEGYRLTPQRLAVLRIVAASREHPTVERVYDLVRAELPTTSLATVYKTLTTLKQVGEVTELNYSGQGSHYDGNTEPHPHAVCTACGGIADAPVSALSRLAAEVAASTGYLIGSQRLDFFGLCPLCQAPAED